MRVFVQSSQVRGPRCEVQLRYFDSRPSWLFAPCRADGWNASNTRIYESTTTHSAVELVSRVSKRTSWRLTQTTNVFFLHRRILPHKKTIDNLWPYIITLFRFPRKSRLAPTTHKQNRQNNCHEPRANRERANHQPLFFTTVLQL